jgi:transposase-like protein
VGRLARHGRQLQRGDEGEGGPAGGDQLGGVAAADRQRGDAALRKWLRQAEVDEGKAAGVPTAEAAEVRALKRKVSELERTISILTEATWVFALEADPLRR